MKLRLTILPIALLAAAGLHAHPYSFDSKISYSSTRPTGGPDSIAQWTGAAFDADNIGGSGENLDGGAHNGTSNDNYTYVAPWPTPTQGQTFTTGSNPDGYNLSAVTIQIAGYTNNNATGANRTFWNLDFTNGPVMLFISAMNGRHGADLLFQTTQLFTAGGTGSPGEGASANGPGTYVTFHLPFSVHLKPNTVYAFDIALGNGNGNRFEWLGTRHNVYAGGSAYHRSWPQAKGIAELAGDRVFMLDMTAGAAPRTLANPGTLHTQADIARMKAGIAAGKEPWVSGYQVLLSSKFNNLNWPAYHTDYINRGGGAPNNYTRSQEDAQAIYTLALLWHLTGNAAYANRAVYIANVWSNNLRGITGDTNSSLAAGICGYLFAIGGDLLSAYPGWSQTDQQAYRNMVLDVFYPANLDFLWRAHDTAIRNGGHTHYRLNWETANMASIAAIGILCDNSALYEQALDYFTKGTGNGRIERAAWYIHSDGLAQTEESGRDQPHNLGGWHAMALLCQMAWNQGDDLFGYDNNRVLRAFEYNAKYNLGHEVPWTFHRNTTLNYTETLSGWLRGIRQYYHYELIYNHYVNVKGIAAPWNKLAAEATRPEPWPNIAGHPSQVDWIGLGTLTYSREPHAIGNPPSGLTANRSMNRVILNWWGTSAATSYEIKRATSQSGPYATLGAAPGPDLNFTDADVSDGATYFYVVTANTPAGNLDSDPLRVSQALVAHYTFDGNADDSAGDRHGSLKGKTLPGFVSGVDGGQALSLNGNTQYVELPVGSGNFEDITIATWVFWNGGGTWQRIFDFGSEIEKYMMLTPSSGGNMRFEITTSRGNEGTGRLNGPILPVSQWKHVAVTLNGDTGSLYVDGALVDTAMIDQVEPFFGQPYCYIGRSMWNGDPAFNGRIDDFRIYNYALSSSEVAALSGRGGPGNPPAFSGKAIAKPKATEDQAYSGQTLAANASDPNGDTLTFRKLWGPAWLAISSGGSLSGTPGNGDVGLNIFGVRVMDGKGNADEARIEIEVLNVNDPPTWNVDPIIRLHGKTGEPYTDSVADYASDIDSGHGDVLTFSKTSGPAWLKVHANGGISGTPGSANQGLNTFILRVTDSEAAYAEVSYRVAVDLIAHYKFESSAGDSLGFFHGTTTGSPAYATGYLGQAIDLDGIDDHVALPAGVANWDEITIATWVYWRGGAQWQRIFDFGNNTSSYLFLTPRSGNNTMRFAITNSGGEQVINTSTLTANQWVHVAVTLKGATGTLYVNGSPAAFNTAITIRPADFNPVRNYIGQSQWPDPLFNGLIDDFRIYNRALSASEIAAVYTGTPEDPPLTGISIGTTGSWGGDPDTTRDAALDGDLTSYFNSHLATGGWVGLDLGEPHVITQIRYAPRPGYSQRIVGGVFQGSYTADFSSGVVTFYTVQSAPPDGVFTEQSIFDPNAFRYVRYLGPAESHSNVAAIQFFGYTDWALPPPPQPRVELGPTAEGWHEFRVSILSFPGLGYQLQRSDDLTPGSWFDIGTAHAGTGGEIELIDSFQTIPSGAFYRIDIHWATP
jgi:hypothetical protein